MISVSTVSRKWSLSGQKMEQSLECAESCPANAPEIGAIGQILDASRLQIMDTLLSYQGVGRGQGLTWLGSIAEPESATGYPRA